MSKRSALTRSLKSSLVLAVLTSLLAACAGTGRTPAAGLEASAAPPVVTDPAPIVRGTMRPYQIRGRWYRPEEQPAYDEVGLASWYGAQFNGRPTATGERFDMNALTAAHKTLPLPGLVEVTNLANGRRVVLRVNDRGPFVDDRIIDLSRGAAEALDLLVRGVGEVRVRYLGRAPRLGGGTVIQQAALPTPSTSAPMLTVASQTLWLEVAAYREVDRARDVAARLGNTAQVQAAADQSMFRVLLGPWSDRDRAERARRSVAEDGFVDARLISGR